MAKSGSRLQPGDSLGGFVLEEQLHRGGMGGVWLARRDDLPEPVILKTPFLNDGEDASTVMGFEAERMILPRLAGPHAPRFVAAGDVGAAPFLAMERIPGESLEQHVTRGRLDIAEIVAIGRKIASGLQDLHDQHVLHLDVKPANIMLRPDGSIVFLDFGLSRHDALPDLIGEETELPVGTGAYIAPEQILGHRGDPRSDIFALGVILYELVTGEPPFGSPQSPAGMRKRLWRDPVPPRALNKDCPPWLQDIILRCLEVHPDARFSSAAQLAFALDHPDQTPLTARAERTQRDGLLTVLRRWLRSRRMSLITRRRVGEVLAQAPIIVAAVDLSASQRALAEALSRQCRLALDVMPEARLACICVLKTNLLSPDESTDAEGRNLYVQRLVELKDWARPLQRAQDQISFHVLEAVDPADALLDYVRHNHVDHIILGARSHSSLRRHLGSVSAKIAAEAPCSVTVVRVRAGAERG